MNYDSIWVLDAFRPAAPGYRAAEMMAAGEKLTTALMTRYLKPDCGFTMNGENCVRVHHSIVLSDEGHPIGDTMGTRMCLSTLSMIDGWENAG